MFYVTLLFILVGLIHGDFDQYERNDILKRFKNKEFLILVATDVAGKVFLKGSYKALLKFSTYSCCWENV